MSDREIKFRGKDIVSGEWLIGDLIKNSVIDPFTYIAVGIGYKVNDTRIGKSIKVYPDSVGQFTGLLDKNGKDVYEGDIIQYPKNKEKAEITYLTALGRWLVEGIGCEWRDDELTEDHMESVEVIGNVFENKELLEENPND